MKKKIKIFISVLLLICLVIGIFLTVKLSKKWPEKIAYSGDNTKFFTEDGMYYFDSANCLLKFYDNATKTSVVVCAKPNCEHREKTCNGYYDAFAPNMMVYNDKIYIGYFNSYTKVDDNGDIYIESVVGLDQVNMDGSGRKELYSADTGAVLSMLAADGKLYYTAYKFQNGFELNSYFNDCTLYCYDINWGTTKELCTFKATESQYNANMYLLEMPDVISSLHFLYSYSNENDQRITKLMTYYLNGNTEEKPFPDSVSIKAILEQGVYFSLYKEAANIREFLFVNEKGDKEKLAEMYDYCDIYHYPGYFYFINSDENRILYDYENDIWYVANTTIGEEEKWISDVYYIDVTQDIIYYDPTDYTGIEAGSYIAFDMIGYASGSWQEFLQENFTIYNGQELEWFKVIEGGEPMTDYDEQEFEWINVLREGRQ